MPLYARFKTIVVGLLGVVTQVKCREVILPGNNVRIRCAKISNQFGRKIRIEEEGLVGALFLSEKDLKTEVERRIRQAMLDYCEPQREPLMAQS